MQERVKQQKGFTIVELLIVIVVIAILAAITVVAYTGIKERADATQVQSALTQTNKQILAYAAEHADAYPATLGDIGVSDGDVVYEYTSNNTASPRTYSLTAWNTTAGDIQYYISSTTASISEGVAPGHNLMPWDEPDGTTRPISGSGTAIVTNTHRSAPTAIRIAPNNIYKDLRLSPFLAEVGQTLSIRFWMKTDSNWDGTGGQSKVRLSFQNSGNYIAACGYEGVKTSWTELVCNYTFSTPNEPVRVTFGNDGTTGNIWFDDIHVSIQ